MQISNGGGGIDQFNHHYNGGGDTASFYDPTPTYQFDPSPGRYDYSQQFNNFQTDFFRDADPFAWTQNIIGQGGEYDPSWIDSFNLGDDGLKNTDFFDTDLYPDLSLEEAGMLEDITSIDQAEKNVLEDYGLISYNDDGSVNDFDSNQAITKLQEYANDPNLSNYERTQLLDTASQLIAAVDAGLDHFEFSPNVYSNQGGMDQFSHHYGDTSQDYINTQPQKELPIGAYNYSTIGGVGYADPLDPNYVPEGDYVVSGGKVPFFGNSMRDGLSKWGTSNYQDPDYMTPGMKALQGVTPAQAMNQGGSMISPSEMQRAEMRSSLAADKYGTDSRGFPNQMIPGQQYTPQPTMASRVDDFTDDVRDFGGMLLKPVNWLTDTVGSGFQKVGQAVGNNAIGRGIHNFGGLIDGTGDYLFGDSDRNSLLGTVMRVPDQMANIGQGIYHGDWDMVKASSMGLLGAPLSILGNVASPFVSGLVDVAGIDELKISAGGGAGGGGRGKGKSKPKARKNVPIIGNTGTNSGGIKSGSAGGLVPGGSGGVATEDGVDYDLTDQQGRNDFADKYGEGRLGQRLADLGIVTTGSVGSDKTFESTDADTSQVAKSIGANQGNPSGVQKAPEMDVIDAIAGAGPEVEAAESVESDDTSFIDRPSDLFEPMESETPSFRYNQGDEAFA